MPSRCTVWCRKKLKAERERRGNRCCHPNCKVTYKVNSKGRPTLQFAHTRPTEVQGRGRGSYRRVRDILDHPESYDLMCYWHHRLYDEATDYAAHPAPAVVHQADPEVLPDPAPLLLELVSV